MDDQAAQSNLVPFPGADNLPTAQRLNTRPVPDFNEGQIEREISFGEIFQALRSHWLWILAAALVTSLLVGIYCLIQAPLYTATSSIEIKGYAPVLAAAQVESLFGNDTRKLEYQKTTIAKLRRPGIADRVLSQPGMADTVRNYLGDTSESGSDEVQPPISEPVEDSVYRQPEKLIARYLGLLDINPLPETSIVEISATSRDPAFSQKIANAHAEGFIEELRLERQQSMKTNVKALQAQAKSLKEKLSESEEALAEYAENNGVVTANDGKGEDLTTKKILGLSELLTEATSRRVKSENLLAQLRSVDASDASTLDDEAIRDLQLQLQKLQSEYKALGTKVTAEYPAMIDMKSRIDYLSQAIIGQRQRLMKGLEIQVMSDKAAEEKMSQQLEGEKTRAFDTSRQLARYSVLQKESLSLRSLYEAVLKQLQETEISAAGGVSNILVSDYAQKPSTPSFPKTKMFLLVGFFFGGALGVLVVVMKELFDARIRGAEDVSGFLKLPILGSVPSFERRPSLASLPQRAGKKLLEWRNENAKVNEAVAAPQENAGEFHATEIAKVPVAEKGRVLVTVMTPNAAVSEALRTIRAGLMLSSVDRELKIIMVTSAEKGAGKTTLAANLAVALAQADCRTLLVDCDMRQSALGGLFPEMQDRKGLSECLAGHVSLEEAIIESSVPKLSLISAGSRPPSPSEVVGSRRMYDMLQGLRTQFDYILVDAPPILPVADGLMLSRAVDSVVLVARQGKTLRKSIREARRRLTHVHANILGVVVNDADPELGEVYGGVENTHYFDKTPPPGMSGTSGFFAR